MRLRGLASFLSGLALLAASGLSVTAQDRDVRPLIERLDRLERDMNLLQRQVYRGGGAGAPTAVTPAPGGAAVDTELRMDQIENQMRTLTGQIEELNYSIDQMKQRLDRFSGDVDTRFKELERGGGESSASPAAPVASLGSAPASRAPGAAPSGGNPPSGTGQSGTLGTLPGGRPTSATLPSASAPGESAPAPGQQGQAGQGQAGQGAPQSRQSASLDPGALPAGSAQDQYNYAFGLLRQADYPAAEKALRSFLQRYPNDPLAGNAQYWLGETYYVRGDYNNAAAAFAEGYRKYPQGGKGPDSLLKLGMSLGSVGQKRDACLSLAQLDKDFPKASANITERAKSERQRLECEKVR
jgi:tol-pal system protein YbgF